MRLHKVFKAAKLPGRFEIRQIQGKTVIFDAGHNPHGVEFLLNQLRNFLNYNKQYTEVISVFSMLADKDINSVVELLKDSVVKWKIATLTVPRAAQIDNFGSGFARRNSTTLRQYTIGF